MQPQAAPFDAGLPPAAPEGLDDMDASETHGAGGNGSGPDDDTPEDRDAMDVPEAPEANPAPPTTGKL